MATQHENSQLKEEVDQLKEEIEWPKGDKRRLEGRNSQLDSHLRRLLVYKCHCS